MPMFFFGFLSRRSFIFSWGLNTVLLGTLSAASFYVSNTGDDANNGAIEAPFASIGHAIETAETDDSIFLERGSVFRESSLRSAKNLTIAPYGESARPAPVLTGSLAVSGWQESTTGSGIFVAAFSRQPHQLYVDGVLATLARTPNTGWLRTDEGTGTDEIVDLELTTLEGNAANRWEGAQVRWRKWSWWYETRPITSDDGNGTLTLGGSSSLSGGGGEGGGYYIDNALAALDAPGEWWWDPSAQKLYFYVPEGLHPDDLEIEAMVEDQGIELGLGTFRGITVRCYRQRGLYLTSRAMVEDCVIERCEDFGIYAFNWIQGSAVRRCQIRDVLNVGIYWSEFRGSGQSAIENNRIERIGVVPGLGGSGSWHAAGVILSRGNGVLFQNNRITETGYAGIIVGAPGQTVRRNVFRLCMSTMNDGAAIYTNCGDTLIEENIILDTIGDLDSSHPWYGMGHGIWPEFLGSFSGNQIIGNTVCGSGGHGLWLPNNFDATVQGNRLLSNLQGDLDLGGWEPGRSDGTPAQNHTIMDNLIGDAAVKYAPREPQNFRDDNIPVDVRLSFHVFEDRDLDYGSMEGTQFLVHQADDALVGASEGSVIGTIDWAAMRYLSFSEWQAEEAAWADPSPSLIEGYGYLFINDTEETYSFAVPDVVGWQTLAGEAVGAQIVVEPFQTEVLLSEGGLVADLPAYFLASESTLFYERWVRTHNLVGADAAGSADPDLDGRSNWEEFYVGSDPLEQGDATGLAVVSAEGEWHLQLTRRRDLRGVRATLRFSDDLVTWTDALELQDSAHFSAWIGLTATGTLEHLELRQRVSLSEHPFWRIEYEAEE